MQRTFTREFKLALCKRIKDGEIGKTRACRDYRLGNGTVERWIEQYEVKGQDAFRGGPWRVEMLNADARAELLEEELRQARLELAFARQLLNEKKSG